MYTILDQFDILDETDYAVPKDETINLAKKDGAEFKFRRIAYFHDPHKKVYESITNNFELPPDNIAENYENRWQIETMFKRLKQNFMAQKYGYREDLLFR